MKELWTEKYRPKDVDGYVFTDISVKEQVEEWIKDGHSPHLLLHGPAGTGKTTLAKILVNQLGIDSYDFLQVNASRDNGVDFLKTKIEGFVSTLPSKSQCSGLAAWTDGNLCCTSQIYSNL